MHSVKTHRTAKHRVAPNINYGIQLMTMYKNHLISCSKCTTLIQDIRGWGGSADLAVLTVQFFCKSKTALKL